MSRILVVEDDVALARGIVGILSQNGHAVDLVNTGALALEYAESESYDALVLDVGLPDISGFEVLQALRRRGQRIPVLILTARDTLEDRVQGLDMGGDDYMLKPFEPAELLARLRALIRRSHNAPDPEIRVGALVCDPAATTARVGDRVLDLRRREWTVLLGLATRAGKVVPKERLVAETFGFDEDAGPNAIEVYVARLRKKLGPNGPAIRSLRGLGYMMDG